MTQESTVYAAHKFRGKSVTRSCELCGQLRIHSNHKGIDYDVEEQTQPHISLYETIAEEAQRIVYGDREKAYDDPNQNFRRLAHMWNGVLDKKLAPGASISLNDVALMMVCLKISRESFRPNRENRVDGIGYFLCLDRIVEAKEESEED